MKILHVASEVSPFSKSGGLADVVGALSVALASEGNEVWTISPRYAGSPAQASPTGLRLGVPLAGATHDASLYALEDRGVRHLFVDNAMFRRRGLYGDEHGTFGDNHIRFALLCQAALHAAHRLIGEDPILHLHDWQAALVPIYLRGWWQPLGLLPGARTVLSLHNPMHQGRLPSEFFADLELPGRWFAPWALEFHGDLGLLKGGILHADQLSTVSPTFAREILTPGGGFGLDTVLASRAVDVTGILNGLDVDAWDPSTDPHLPAAYSSADLAGKEICKAELQAELGLPIDPAAPLIGSVGRLDPQKGIELLADSIPWMAGQGAQVVVLGSAAAAHRHFEDRLRRLEDQHPHHVRAWVGFSEGLSHRIHAGADLFLMPSLFEPCGLTQMSSMRYGTPPVVRRTGGLADTVVPFASGSETATGFVFGPPTGHALRDALYRAIRVYREDAQGFRALQQRGMATDFSWSAAVPGYLATYERARALYPV